MHTFFNDNQNLPLSENKQETFSIFHHLQLRLQAKEAITYFAQATLLQVVWLSEVNGSIFNINRCCYEYSCNLSVKSLILEFIKGLPPTKHIFLLPYVTTVQTKRKTSGPKALFSQKLLLLGHECWVKKKEN